MHLGPGTAPFERAQAVLGTCPQLWALLLSFHECRASWLVGGVEQVSLYLVRNCPRAPGTGPWR